MRYIFSLIILAFAIFGGYRFVTENVDFENGIEIKQSFKDDMSAVSDRLKSWTDSVIDYFKN